jgi:hypothetical protein
LFFLDLIKKFITFQLSYEISFASGGQGPLGEGSLYAAQIVGVGFHSFPGEGAAS